MGEIKSSKKPRGLMEAWTKYKAALDRWYKAEEWFKAHDQTDPSWELALERLDILANEMGVDGQEVYALGYLWDESRKELVKREELVA